MDPNIILGLAKRRGFFFPSFEIYGGMAGLYDYGPLGSTMKTNIESLWRNNYVMREGMSEIFSPIISPEDVFRASGHLSEFTDFSVQCQKCNQAFRADHLLEEVEDNPDAMSQDELQEAMVKHGIKCPSCKGGLSEPVSVNLMFKTMVGPIGGRDGYMRPETAQAMFFNFHLLYKFNREKLPFGIVQLGKGFRNEISPRQSITRVREFNMMEAEVFFDPSNKVWPGFDEVSSKTLRLLPDGADEQDITLRDAVDKGIIANEPLAYFMHLTQHILTSAGLDSKKLRFRQHLKTEMAHYAEDCWDCEAMTGYGWLELVGIADRGCYDLQSHIDESGAELTAFIRFPEPIEMEATIIVPNLSALGPLFKGKAGAIATKLSEMPCDGLDTAIPIVLDMDGEEVSIPPECFTISQEKKKVSGKRIVPHVIEPSYGLDRIFYTVMDHNYKEDGEYVTLGLPVTIAPIKFGVFPLMSKDGLDDMASDIDKKLRQKGLLTYYDGSGTIGRRYARMDEAGTPFCITVDYETKEDGCVTIRDRDTKDQKRVKMDDLERIAISLADSSLAFEAIG